MTKFCNGICLFFVLMCVIWAPMLMYSSGNPTNIANPIKDASARVDIKTSSGRLTLFETTLCEKISWEKLEACRSLDPQGYLSAYNEKDIQLICCQSDASTLWLVLPIVQARFIKSLRWNMDITFSWEFIRDRPKGKEAVNYELTIQEQDLPKSSEVTKVFNGTSNSFTVFNIYPRYFRVIGSGDVRSLEQSVELVSGALVLNRGDPEWWSFYDFDILGSHGCGKFPGPMAIIVSEETPQGIIGDTLSEFSIWGLYITFVLAVGRFIRLQCSDLRMRIPFENLPSCDRLMAICEDIYAARAAGELEVEEVLYWTLVKIYRSPHMLLEYTQAE
ncbi:Piezo-type mechanosensitive ion channel-like [Spatholobus suberectus]|nr:Piezo-type mechanosensitive ion channel-like [Spatholobus suberectus]